MNQSYWPLAVQASEKLASLMVLDVPKMLKTGRARHSGKTRPNSFHRPRTVETRDSSVRADSDILSKRDTIDMINTAREKISSWTTMNE